MAKGHADQTDKMLDTTLNRANTQYGAFNDVTQSRSNDAYQRQTSAYDSAMAGYQKFAQGAGAEGGFAGFAGGGYSAPQFKQVDYSKVAPTYDEFMKTGGIDPTKMRVGNATLEELMKTGGVSEADNASINKSIAGYEGLQSTGGIDDASANRMRGLGVYDEFAKTGGLSDADISNIRRRAVSTIPSFYGGITDEMNRQRRISGGSSAMGNAAALKAARGASRDTSDAALNAELGIRDRVIAGRQFGAAGASQSEGNLQALKTGNQLAALRGSSDLALGRSQMTSGVRSNAANSLAGIEGNIQDLTQRGRMFGTEGNRGMAEMQTQIANQQASANASAGGANAALAERAREFDIESQLSGIGGIAALRGQTPGEDAFYSGQTLAGIQGQTGANLSGVGMRYQSPNATGSVGQTLGGIAGGVFGSYLSGGGFGGFLPFGGGKGGGTGTNPGSLDAGGFPIENPGNSGYGPGLIGSDPTKESMPGMIGAGQFGTEMYNPYNRYRIT